MREAPGPAAEKAPAVDSNGVVDVTEAEGDLPSSAKLHSKRTSEIWAYYTEEGAKPKHALCQLASRDNGNGKCNEEISFAGGTTGLWNHCMWHHPDKYIKLSKEKPQKKGAASGGTGGVPAQLPKMSGAMRHELHKAHARWLTKKKRPLSIVVDPDP